MVLVVPPVAVTSSFVAEVVAGEFDDTADSGTPIVVLDITGLAYRNWNQPWRKPTLAGRRAFARFGLAERKAR